MNARKTGILAAAAALTLGALTGCPGQPPRNSYWIGEDGQQHTVTHDQAHRWWDRDH